MKAVKRQKVAPMTRISADVATLVTQAAPAPLKVPMQTPASMAQSIHNKLACMKHLIDFPKPGIQR